MARRLTRGLVLVALGMFLGTFAAPGGVAPPADTTPPVADAGPDQTVDEDTPVTFDGSGSSDDVGIVNYTWTFLNPAPPGSAPIVYAGPGGDAVLDPTRPYLYAASSDRVVFVNLATKTVEKTFPLNRTPQAPLSIAVSPAGTYLVVGIPIRPHDYYWFDPHEGYFASFDLVRQTQLGEFQINEDPFDILVTSDGTVIVSGGSGQWTSIRMYDATTGSETGSAGSIRQMSYIGLHPSERRVYSVETDQFPPHLNRHDFVPGSGFVGAWTWPYHGEYVPGLDVWATSRGDRLVTGSGLLLAASDNPSEDMRVVQRLTSGGISAAASDADLELVAVGTGATLFFDLNTYELLGSYDPGGYTTDLVFRASRLYAYNGQVVDIPLPKTNLFGVAPTHGFAEPGTVVVTLTVRDAAGNSDTDTVAITARDITPPVADAGPDRTLLKGTLVTLDALASTDNVGIAGYSWSFVDGGPQAFEGPYMSYRFANAGVFVVTLTVTDTANNIGTDTATVAVNPDTTPPVADAGLDRLVYKGAVVTFDGSGSTDNVGVGSYTWTFTDGTPQTLSGVRPSYRFSNPGTFSVTLTVRDSESNVGTDTLTITVLDFALVEYDRVVFRIGLPSGWEVSVNSYVPDIGSVDLAAEERLPGGATIAVSSRAAAVQTTDDFLLATARSALLELQYRYGFVIVVKEPEIVEAANSRAAVFEVGLGGDSVRQIWAVLANARYGRVMFVVGTTGSGSIETYRTVFDAVIRSAFMNEPPDPVRTMVLVLVAFLALSLGPLLGILAWLGYRGRSARAPKPATEGPAAAVPAVPGIPPPAMGGVGPGTATVGTGRCPACGSPFPPSARFCGRCGAKIG